MDFLKKASDSLGGNKSGGDGGNGGDGGGNGLMDKVNSAAGGGAKGEQNEDYLDKGVDLVQERVMGQGDQSNESAAEQAKDEAISDFVRDKYKDTTGKDFFIADKDKKFGV